MKIVNNIHKLDIVISGSGVGAGEPGKKVKRKEKSITWIFTNEYKAKISVYDRKREAVDRYAYKRPYVQEAILLEKDPEHQFSFHPTNEESWKELDWNKEPKFEVSASGKELSAHHVAVREKLEKIMMRLTMENHGKSPVFDKGDTVGIFYRDEVVPATRHCRSLKDEPGSKLAVVLLKLLKKEGAHVQVSDPSEATMLLNIPLLQSGQTCEGAEWLRFSKIL